MNTPLADDTRRPSRKHRKRTCPTPGKVAYRTQGAAINAAVHMARRWTSRPYECLCGRWHLTCKRAVV